MQGRRSRFCCHTWGSVAIHIFRGLSLFAWSELPVTTSRGERALASLTRSDHQATLASSDKSQSPSHTAFLTKRFRSSLVSPCMCVSLSTAVDELYKMWPIPSSIVSSRSISARPSPNSGSTPVQCSDLIVYVDSANVSLHSRASQSVLGPQPVTNDKPQLLPGCH